jgi:hypothetical protein
MKLCRCCKRKFNPSLRRPDSQRGGPAHDRAFTAGQFCSARCRKIFESKDLHDENRSLSLLPKTI